MASAAGLVVGVGACSTPKSADGGSRDAQVTLADTEAVGAYNPVAGYGATGVSPLYEGLLRPEASSDESLPKLAPALAASEPKVSDGGKTWTVSLRSGVTFHDGSAFDSGDVAATYRAVQDPKSGSAVADDYKLIDRIDTPDGHTVVFRLKAPNSGFGSRLLLGIAPSEKIGSGDASKSSLNAKPVGTGPYKLQSLSANEAVMVSNDTYRLGAPQVKKLIFRHVDDDNARLQQVMTGQVDGAALPPRLAKSAENKDGLKVVGVNSADWRAVSLPVATPLTSDAAVRRALNVAVDRDAIVASVLAGHGHAALTPISQAYPQHEKVSFTAASSGSQRRAEAEKALDAAGWTKGKDGIRAKGGERAKLTVAYPATDTLRRELASAFADQMRPLGIDVTLWGGSWDDIEPKLREVAVLLGGGDNPYTVDTQAHRALHSRGPLSGPFDNPGNYANAGVDRALDMAQATADQKQADAQYRVAQREYVKDPGYVFLATLEHTYVVRDTGFSGPAPILEPHSHGTTWGPWWSIGRWSAT